MSKGAVLWAGGIGLLVAGAAVLSLRGTARISTVALSPATLATLPATLPTTTPATQASSQPTSKPAMKSFLDFARAVDKHFEAADAELISDKVSLSMEAAATVVTDQPVHLDRRGNLWVTHPDAPPIRDQLKNAAKDQLILTRDRVEFVYWIRNTAGEWVAQPITRATTAHGDVFTWHAPHCDLKLARDDYRFSNLMLLPDDRMIVPTKAGVATLRAPALPPPEPEEGKRPVGYKPATAPTHVPESFIEIEGQTPVTIFAVLHSAVALRPWDNGFRGSDAGYVHTSGATTTDAGSWAALTGTSALPAQPMHLFALSDGSTLVLSAAPEAGMEISTISPSVKPDPARDKRVADLVEALNAPAAEQRVKAASDLARFGPSAWPVLEQLRDAQTPDAQAAINKLLGLRARPALGVFQLLPGPVRLVARGDDGTLALFAFGGVGYFEEGEDQVRSPALLIAPPDRGSYLAHPSVLKDREGAELNMQLQGGEVIVRDGETGPLRLLGNHLSAMLKPELHAFDRWIGTDRRDRWLFADDKTGRTLIIDRHIEDPKPRLPAWTLGNDEGQSGWDDQNQLVIVRGEKPWRLKENGWDAMDPKTAKVFLVPDASTRTSALTFTDPADKPRHTTAPVASSTTASTTRRATEAVTMPATMPAGLLGGSDPLQVLLRPGSVDSLLTPLASGVATMQTAPNRFYYFDGQGKALRLSHKGEDILTEATFTENIPTEGVRRVWLDPYGRICIVHGTGKATVLFPTGRIPASLSSLMSGGAP